MIFSEVECERAAGALGRAATVCLSDSDGQRVEFIEVQAVRRGRLRGKCELGESMQLAVSAVVFDKRRGEQMVALTDAAEVLVGNGDGVAQRVKQDGVRSLRADAGKSEKFLLKHCGWSG